MTYCKWCGTNLSADLPEDLIPSMLAPREMLILVKLFQHRGQTVTKEMCHLTSDGGMKVYINRIRNGLRDIGSSWVIETVYGSGYKLMKAGERNAKAGTAERSKAHNS